VKFAEIEASLINEGVVVRRMAPDSQMPVRMIGFLSFIESRLGGFRTETEEGSVLEGDRRVFSRVPFFVGGIRF